MPKKNRLTGDEMKTLKGRRIHGTLFSLTIAPVGGKSPKAAFVVSKKVALKAVKRNSIERKCRAVVGKLLPQVSEPLALVFVAKREAADATFGEIEKDLTTLLSRLSTRS